jgi:hypothetical protein
MNVHSRKSSTAEVPLQKSAATTARKAFETGEASTSGRASVLARPFPVVESSIPMMRSESRTDETSGLVTMTASSA